MQKKYFEAFLAGILTLKTVLQSAPEHDILIQKIENFGDWNTPSHNHYRRRIWSSTRAPSLLDPCPLYKILDTPLPETVTLGS